MRGIKWLGAISLCGLVATPAWALDLTRYAALKGTEITLTKVSNQVYATSQQFDPATGARLPDRVEALSLDDLKAQRDGLTAQLGRVNALIADVEALP